jgi:flavin reductase (DIM6/NTAB) family NADH-FMN oxidoreductase RutF
MFICPRPVVLVSLLDGERGNIFPMNLMGSIGEGYLAFALNSKRQAAPLVERVGQLALSTLPFDQSTTAQELGKNHYQESIDWEQLPFTTRPSTVLGIPVPHFAVRVRELRVREVRRLGSHTFFVAKIVGDECLTDGPAYYMIHGMYEAWRRRTGKPAQQLITMGEQTVLPARQ